MKKSYVIGAVILVLAVVMAMDAFKSTLISYVTVGEAKESGQPVQVAGIVSQDSAKYDLEINNLVFTLREDGGDEMRVQYAGPQPANFDDATKIVAVGKYEPSKQVFVAEELLVKCPTKYESRVEGK